MTRLFAKFATRYWERGLSVIPLEPASKRPAQGVKNWTGFCDNLPKVETRAAWMERYVDSGIGLCLGTSLKGGGRIGAIDVDDDRFVPVVRVILGDCPSVKRGKKGETIFVRADRDVKSTTIFDADKLGIIDVLMSGKMTVLPPSIHPETGKPYHWVGQPLLEVEDDTDL